MSVVFDIEAHYFKTNNQIDLKSYPWLYYSQTQDNPFLKTLQPGDLLDAIKYDSSIKKATWSRAVLKEIDDDIVTVRFLNDSKSSDKDIVADSVDLAPVNTHSKDF